MFELIQAILTRLDQGQLFLLSNSMASRHLKTTTFSFSEEFWVSTISKTSTFEIFWDAQNLFKVFLPVRSAGFCLLLGLGAAAPEAKHHCTSQPRPATTPWLSSSSRPRRPWMCRRTTMAISSDEDLGGKPPEAWDREDVDEMMKCWSVDGLSVLVEIVFIKFGWCTRIKHVLLFL